MLFALFWLSVLLAALVFTGLGVMLLSLIGEMGWKHFVCWLAFLLFGWFYLSLVDFILVLIFSGLGLLLFFRIREKIRSWLLRWFPYLFFTLLLSFLAFSAGSIYFDHVHPAWIFPYWASLAAAYLVLGWLLVHRAGVRLQRGFRAQGPAWRTALVPVLAMALVALSWTLLDWSAQKRLYKAYLQSQEMARSLDLVCRDPEMNAVPYYQKALALCKGEDLEKRLDDPEFWLWTPDAKRVLTENREALPALRQALSGRRFCPLFDESDFYGPRAEYDQDTISSLLGPIRRRFARLFFLEAMERMDKGDYAGALDSLEDLERMAKQVDKSMSFIPVNIVGGHMQSSEAVFARLPSDFKPWRLPVRVPPNVVSECEQRMTCFMAGVRHWIYWMGEGHPAIKPSERRRYLRGQGLGCRMRLWVPTCVWRVFFSASDLAYVEKNQERIFSILSKPYHQILPAFRQRAGELENEPIWLWEATDYCSAGSMWDVSYEFHGALWADASRRLTATAKACYAFRAEKGRWPDSLTELVPEFLEKVLESPFEPAPLGYEKVHGGARLFVKDVDFYLGAGAYREFRVKPWLGQMKERGGPAAGR